MAQYTVTAGGCGHTVTLQLYGPTAAREKRIAWTESTIGLCNTCYAAKKRASERENLIEEKVSQLLLHPDSIRTQRSQIEEAIRKGEIDADNTEVFRRVLLLLSMGRQAHERE